MVRLSNYLLRQKHLGSALVQLGGLEPPTSCSTVIGLASFDGSRCRTPPQKAPFYLHLLVSRLLRFELKWSLVGC